MTAPIKPSQGGGEHTDNRAQLAYETFLGGFSPPSTLPKWSDAPPWLRDVAQVAYLQGKLDGRSDSHATLKARIEVLETALRNILEVNDDYRAAVPLKRSLEDPWQDACAEGRIALASGGAS